MCAGCATTRVFALRWSLFFFSFFFRSILSFKTLSFSLPDCDEESTWGKICPFWNLTMNFGSCHSEQQIVRTLRQQEFRTRVWWMRAFVQNMCIALGTAQMRWKVKKFEVLKVSLALILTFKNSHSTSGGSHEKYLHWLNFSEINSDRMLHVIEVWRSEIISSRHYIIVYISSWRIRDPTISRFIS